MEWVALLLFAAVILLLMAGFPVAFTLAGTGLAFAFAGVIGGGFESAFLTGMPSRLFGIPLIVIYIFGVWTAVIACTPDFTIA